MCRTDVQSGLLQDLEAAYITDLEQDLLPGEFLLKMGRSRLI
jgi:hypothetical protein